MRVMTGFLSLVHSYFSPPAWATVIAGFFVLVALSFSAFLVFEHLSAYKNPEVFLTSPLLLASVSSHSASMNFHMSVVFLTGAEVLNWGHLDGPLLFNRVYSLVFPAQMAVASVAHLFVFPAKPYELLADQSPGNVSVLGDYASADCPIDPDEVRDSTRPTKLRLPQPDVSVKSVTDIRESVRDIVVGVYISYLLQIVNDFKFTVTQAVEPVEKSFTRLNEKLHRISENIKKHDKDRRKARDDSCITSPMRRAVRGIDDPLLNGTTSDGGASRGRQRSRKSGYTSESGGESSKQGHGEYEIHGCRWVTRD
ncbi:hypothetical protein GW17_00050397 [Ensete ventricosum]|nr:hypothetical protein GW17_00050397 [Ensete ventricosum]